MTRDDLSKAGLLLALVGVVLYVAVLLLEAFGLMETTEVVN